MEPISILLGISFILFFGFFAEFMFKRFRIPDVLFLILLGILIGPTCLKYVSPSSISSFAPIFTTFALLFLLFDGAFNIDLASFARGFSHSIMLTLFNFVTSSLITAMILIIVDSIFSLGISPMIALMAGFTLGGVSSSFVIPLLKQMDVKKETYSILTLESALTDVFCIIFSLTTMELISLNTFDFRAVLSSIISLFAVAGLVGLISSIIWVILTKHLFNNHNKHYMVTIAFVILVYVMTEYLSGNGAIATLVFGIVLKNSKLITSIFKGVVTKKKEEKEEALTGQLGVSVTTTEEEFFYDQISFFLKTFFFVYIGILLDFSDIRAIITGILLSLSLMLARTLSVFVTKKYSKYERTLISSIFGRGIAAAAIIQMTSQYGIGGESIIFIQRIVYTVITGTIAFSALKIFFLKPEENKKATT